MENNENITQEQSAPDTGYKERPRYQVWAARIGLVIMIAAVALYYIHIAKGGI